MGQGQLAPCEAPRDSVWKPLTAAATGCGLCEKGLRCGGSESQGHALEVELMPLIISSKTV